MASGDHVWTAGSMPKQSIAAFLSSEPNSQVSRLLKNTCMCNSKCKSQNANSNILRKYIVFAFCILHLHSGCPFFQQPVRVQGS
jgi:hypothetical protein